MDIHRQLACLAATGCWKKNLTCIIRIPCVVPEQDSLSEEVVQGIRGRGETLKSESGEAAVEFK